jgi:hypothetical protein
MGLRLLVLFPTLLLLVGCLNTHQERIRVRRDPDIVDREEERTRPAEYEEYLARMQAEHEARRLTLALKTEENWYEDTRQQVGAITGSIPEDPWAAYEKDRLDTLHRNWADAHLPPPEPEKTLLDQAKSAEDPDDEEEDTGDDEEEDKGDDEDEDEDEYDEDW